MHEAYQGFNEWHYSMKNHVSFHHQ